MVTDSGHGLWASYHNPGGKLQQTLGDTRAVGTYILSADVSHFGPTSYEKDGTPPNQYANAIAQLPAGGNALTADSSTDPGDPGPHQWARKSWTFEIASDNQFLGQILSIELFVLGGGGQGNFDNLRLDYLDPVNPLDVPEPPALAMLGSALASLLCYVRRKRKETVIL